MKALQLFKALADESRLQIVLLLRQRPYCVEDIAENMKLAVSTVSAHLKKLQQAGMVFATKQQYYSVYHLKKEFLEMKIDDLLPQQKSSTPDRSEILRQKVLKTYFSEGKITRLPSQNKKRWIVYQEIIKLFQAGRTYSEKEMNETIMQLYDDYCMVRRELVDEGVLSRQDGIYQLVENYQENPGFYQKIWMESEESTS